MPDAPKDKSLTWWPFAAAAVIAILAVVMVLTVGTVKSRQLGLRTDKDGALTCPATYLRRAVVGVARPPRAWVPLAPSGVNGDDYLVVDYKPTHATVCRYAGNGAALTVTTKLRLDRHRVITANTAAMAKELSKLPQAKKAVSGTCTKPTSAYLVGLVFPTGVEWTGDAGTGCQRITNGSYDTTAGISSQLDAALRTGTWG